MAGFWAGIDAGKSHHHCVVIDQDGKKLLSRKISNSEGDALDLIGAVLAVAAGQHVKWATDMRRGCSTLLLSVLFGHDQQVVYIPGKSLHHASYSYRGEGKTDAKDAAIIADQARIRTDLYPINGAHEKETELRLLLAHRSDLAADRTRAINRLRATLSEYFPPLETEFDYAQSQVALTLLTRYQTPDGIRRSGIARICAWLRSQGCRTGAGVAQRAHHAATQQHTTVTAQSIAAALVAKLAAQVLALDEELKQVGTQIEERFRQHPDAENLLSVPGFGPLPSAEFLAQTGGDMAVFVSADRLAVAGLPPVPRDSERISGNLHRPKRYNRRLLRACYLAADVASRS